MSSTFTVSVLDLACQAAEQVKIQPSVALVTQSQTKIATVLGFPENQPISTPPKKYHTLTASGTSTWRGNVFVYDPASSQIWNIPWRRSPSNTINTTLPGDLGANCGGAQYQFTGSGNIDTNGNRTSYYDNQRFSQCPTGTPPIGFDWRFQLPPADLTGINFIAEFIGYCWTPDPASCGTCNVSPLLPDIDLGESNTVFQFGTPLEQPVVTPTSITDNSTTQAAVVIQPPANAAFPFLSFSDPPIPPQNWIIITLTQAYSFVLSNEYTDAEALGNAEVIDGNGATAQNMPRTTGFVSQFTTVVFELNCTNLIPGQNYLVSVNLYNTANGLSVSHYPFTAVAPTQLISDAIPTPPAGSTTTVRNPTIAFA